ncbi:MAG: NAD(P)H-dependent oxidoreductase [Kiritimatiellota bacterium]|nr:NAD(P)H-dependent oxidoreductase [Kiritimatiellota bacterium]
MHNALLLIGSPKPRGSTSESLGTCLMQGLATRGWTTTQLNIRRQLKSQAETDILWITMDRADLIVIAFPLYVDSLPAPVIRMMEKFKARGDRTAALKTQSLAVIINCGFPENAHNAIAERICHRFAAEMRLTWAGCLSMGEGGALGGKPIVARGLTRPLAAALDSAAAALAAGRPIPPEAVALMAKPIIAPNLYLLAAKIGWWQAAWKNRVLTRLAARPYIT